MKISSLLHCFSIALTVVLALLLLTQVRSARTEQRALQTEVRSLRVALPAPEAVELADVMEKLQRHSSKLYFAGKLANWPLAAFYLEELEEVVEDIARKNVLDGHINISGLMPGLILPEVEKLEAAVASQNQPVFLERYHDLTASCNACHVASNHPFVVIQEPTAPPLDNQRYDAPKAVALLRATH